MSCRVHSSTKLLMALLLLVETLLGHTTVNGKQHFAEEDTIMDDEDVGDAAAAAAAAAVAEPSSSWLPGGQRLLLSRLLMPQGLHRHGDGHSEMGVAEGGWEGHRLSPVIFRGATMETDGESIRRLRILPSGQSQVIADHRIVLGKRDLCCSLDMYCVECSRKRKRWVAGG